MQGVNFFPCRTVGSQRVLHWTKYIYTIWQQGLAFKSLCKHHDWLRSSGTLTPENLIFSNGIPTPQQEVTFFPFFKQPARVMARWTHFISSVQLFPSPTRPPWGQMAPKQLLVSQYIWRHSWNDKSDGATSSSYTKPLFRAFSLVLVCYKQNLMCENKIKSNSFTAPCCSFIFAAFINVTLLPTSAPQPETDEHSLSDNESLHHSL